MEIVLNTKAELWFTQGTLMLDLNLSGYLELCRQRRRGGDNIISVQNEGRDK